MIGAKRTGMACAVAKLAACGSLSEGGERLFAVRVLEHYYLRVLAVAGDGSVTVECHPPTVSDFAANDWRIMTDAKAKAFNETCIKKQASRRHKILTVANRLGQSIAETTKLSDDELDLVIKTIAELPAKAESAELV